MPVVLSKSAAAPVAVLLSAVLRSSAPAPTAVLKLPVVLAESENNPTAVLNPPVVRLKRAFWPAAVLPQDSCHPALERLLALLVRRPTDRGTREIIEWLFP